MNEASAILKFMRYVKHYKENFLKKLERQEITEESEKLEIKMTELAREIATEEIERLNILIEKLEDLEITREKLEK